MATYTPNYNLSKPESTDDMTDFFADYGDNMEIIDSNMGGGGSGGHTIIDENDVSMTQRTGLQFTGNVSVTDDAVNDKTIVDISGGDVADVEVNGISVVDAGTKIAEITSYEEVTIAEYESIPIADRESNGIAYFIKDLNNSHVQGYPPLIFSFEEREVGVWVDGKPLYQRVFDLGGDVQIPYGSLTSTSIDASQMAVIVDAWGIYSTGETKYSLMANKNNNVIRLQTDRNGANATIRYVILYYTKTTDTAGSGTWNGQGGIAHHYSTNETVVGTWFGETYYEKTLIMPNAITLTTSGAWVATGVGFPNDFGVAISASIVSDYMQGVIGVFVNPSTGAISAQNIPRVGNITLPASTPITIQYTKT